MDNARRRARQDPLNYASTFLFVFADVFALTSISLPYWLSTNNAGTMNVGLLSTCLEISGKESICYTPDQVTPEWILTFMFIVIGIAGLTVAAVASVLAFIKNPYEAMNIARFAGLVAIIFFNLAQIVFPSAFGQEQIGGSPFQLPQNFSPGVSYALFFIAHWLAVASELCAAKICRPRWQF